MRPSGAGLVNMSGQECTFSYMYTGQLPPGARFAGAQFAATKFPWGPICRQGAQSAGAQFAGAQFATNKFSGAQFAAPKIFWGPICRGPHLPGPNLPGPNLPGPNLPGPNLPQKIARGPICRGPTCLEPIITTIIIIIIINFIIITMRMWMHAEQYILLKCRAQIPKGYPFPSSSTIYAGCNVQCFIIDNPPFHAEQKYFFLLDKINTQRL